MQNNYNYKLVTRSSMIVVNEDLPKKRKSFKKSKTHRHRRTCVMPKRFLKFTSRDSMAFRPLLHDNSLSNHVGPFDSQDKLETLSILSQDYWKFKEKNLHKDFLVAEAGESPEDPFYHDFTDIREKTPYERIEEYHDRFVFLSLRKVLSRIKFAISELCYRIICSLIFEYFIILVILANIYVLASEDPNSNNSIVQETDQIFLMIYTIEACIKIGGLGLVLSKTSYLRDHWNKMDLIIVIAGWLSTISTTNLNLSSLRTLRVLRPLRSITSINGLRILFVALIKSSIPLFASLTVVFFFLLIFAIAGVQLWVGEFRNQCMDLNTGVFVGGLCGILQCDTDSECVYSLDNPNQGVTNFDNIFFAMLNVFQCITLEGWTNVMVSAQKTFSMYVFLYFIPLVFIGAYLLLNLTLAVIKNAFSKAMDESKIKKSEEEENMLKKNLKKKKKFKPKIEESFEEEIEKQLPSHNVQITRPEQVQITFQNRTLMNSEINKKILPNYENKVVFEIDSSFSEDEFSFASSPRANNYKEYSPEPIFSTRPVQDPLKDSINESNEEKYALKRKSTLIARTLTMRSGENWRQKLNAIYDEHETTSVVHKARNSIKYTIVNRFGFDKEMNKLKIFITENYAFKHSSATDIILAAEIPVIRRKTVLEKNLDFSYSQLPQDSIEYVLDEDLGKLFEKYSYIGNSYKIYCALVLKSNRKTAFSKYYLPVKKVVEVVHERDLMTQTTIGIWSGFEIKNTDQVEKIKLVSKMTFKFPFSGFFQRIRYLILILIENSYFMRAMIFLVVLNTIVLSIDHYGISTDLNTVLSNINTTFTCIFLGEMVLKVLGLGVKNYFRDVMNYFDAAVVIVSMVELIFLNGNKSTLSAFRAIRILRVFRVIRVARLLRYLQSMSLILGVIKASLSKFIYLAILLLLFIVIYALLGMQVFGGNFNFPNGKPRAHFDTFNNAFITIFQVLSIENWNEILYNTMRSSAGVPGVVLLISWIILGNFVLLNLFLAILLEGFSEKENLDDENLGEKIEGNARKQTAKKTMFGNLKDRMKKKREEKMKMMEDMQNDSEESIEESKRLKSEETVQKILFENIECERSYFVFSKSSRLRIFCFNLINQKFFEYVALLIIFLSTLKVVIDTYLMHASATDDIVIVGGYLDIVFTTLFVLEFILKSIGLGLFYNNGSYMKDHWNKLDFFIVLISIIDLSVSSVNITSIKAIRILRTFRPLRFISHNLSMKIVVIALYESLIAIVNVVIVLLIVWLMFAILGVSLLAGKLYSCENSNFSYEIDCIDAGYTWNSLNPNYDNVINAITALFILTSEEGWPDIMYNAVDASEVGRAPIRDYNIYISYYFVIFIFVGSFFFLNLFIGVVFDKFNEAKKSEMPNSAFLLSKDQSLWVEIQKLLPRAKANVEKKSQESALQGFFFQVHKSKYFESLILLCILLNLVQMAMVYNEAPTYYILVLDNINLAVTVVFIFEAAIKLLGVGVKGYFANNWNKFDLFVVISSVLDLVLSYFVTISTKLLRLGPQMLRVIRLLRVSKLIRLFKVLKSLHVLITIIGYSLPAILNVLSLLLLIFFIYSVLGVNLYYNVATGKIINDYTNFSNFGMAMVALFRMTTGEDWYLIMYDCAESSGFTIAAIFFITFITATSFVMLNFFIMVILQTFDDYESNPLSVIKVFSRDIKKIRKVWSAHSVRYGSDRTHFSEIMKIMKEIGKDFGDFEHLEYDKTIKKLSAMQLEIDGFGFIYYNDFLFSVLKQKYLKRVIGKNQSLVKKILRLEEIETLRKLQKMRNKLRLKFYTQEQLKVLDSKKKMNYFMEILNAKTIFKTWKKWTRGRKTRNFQRSISITPVYSEIDFPGDNSEVSIRYLSMELE